VLEIGQELERARSRARRRNFDGVSKLERGEEGLDVLEGE
jgi:hypothetical protein